MRDERHLKYIKAIRDINNVISNYKCDIEEVKKLTNKYGPDLSFDVYRNKTACLPSLNKYMKIIRELADENYNDSADVLDGFEKRILILQEQFNHIRDKYVADTYLSKKQIHDYINHDSQSSLESAQKDFKQRLDSTKRLKRIIVTTLVIVAILIPSTMFLFSVNEKKEQYKEQCIEQYNKADELMKNGNYGEAVEAFSKSDGYKDSDDKIKECIKQANSKVEVGSTYFFGSYEQDGNKDKGKEPIAWQILAKEDNKILIVSKYGLDYKEYSDERENITWENCTLRDWLNSTFMDSAFSKDEKSQVQVTTVKSDRNPKYDTNPGNNTEDKIFLLSIQEAEKYFACEADRSIGEWWWLRSPGGTSYYAASVSNDGSIYYVGNNVNYHDNEVRPALWLEIE